MSDPREPALYPDVRATGGWALEVVERKAVQSVDEAAGARAVPGYPAEDTGLGAVGVHDIRTAQQVGEPGQCHSVVPRADRRHQLWDEDDVDAVCPGEVKLRTAGTYDEDAGDGGRPRHGGGEPLPLLT